MINVEYDSFYSDHLVRDYDHALQPKYCKTRAELYALPHEHNYRSKKHIDPMEKVENEPEFYSDPNYSDYSDEN